jgi:tRNA (cmo5U34)-methyltransferase
MKKEIYPKKLINDYDLVKSAYPLLFKLRQRVAAKIRRKFGITKHINILEIGAGAGETTEYILKLKNVKIIAVENDKTMVRKLKRDFKAQIKAGKFKIVSADIFTYIKKLKKNSFEVVTSSWTIHNFTKGKRQILLRQIYRTLKPNGLFVNMDKYVLDNKRAEEKSMRLKVRDLNKIANHFIAQEAIRHEEEDRKSVYVMKEQETIKLMKKLSFKQIKILQRIDREAVLSAIK